MKWFRLYASVLNDPKVQKLEPWLFKGWINLLCLAAEQDGALPQLADIAFALRMDEERTEVMLNSLIERELVDTRGGVYTPHNWSGRQFESDSSTERVRRYRETKVKQNETLQKRCSNAPDTDSDTDSDTDKSIGKSADKPRTPRPRFVPPTLEDVSAYMAELGCPQCAEPFLNHYTAAGWKLKGGQKMADWQASCRTWRDYETQYAAERLARKRSNGRNGGATLEDYALEAQAQLDAMRGTR